MEQDYPPPLNRQETILSFLFWLQERYISVEKEELLYPSSTMIAEVGGILGLFLGVSFMTLLGGAMLLKRYIAPFLK